MKRKILLSLFLLMALTIQAQVKKIAFVTYNKPDSTLTFSYGIPHQILGDTTAVVIPINDARRWLAYGNKTKSITINPSFADYHPTSTAGWFKGFSRVKTLDLNSLDISTSTSMDSMFMGCMSLEALEWSSPKSSACTTMAHMFDGCDSLAYLDMEWYDATKVRDMSYMFKDCGKLTAIDLTASSPGPSAIEGMFMGCASLTSVDISTFTTTDVRSMAHLFDGCSSLPNVDIYALDTDMCSDFSYMFNDCRSLTAIDVSGMETENVTTMESMFHGCASLTTFDADNMFGQDMSNVTNVANMFAGCAKLATCSLGTLNTDAFRNMSGMFMGCTALKDIDFTNTDLSHVEDMSNLFNGCTSLSAIDFAQTDTYSVNNMSGMFSGCSSLTHLDLSGFDTRQVTDMSSMFYNCSNLQTTLDETTAKVIPALNLSSFHTEKVTTVKSMFAGCKKMKSLDISNFDLTNCTHAEYFMTGCVSLGSLKIGSNDLTWMSSSGKGLAFMGVGAIGLGQGFDACVLTVSDDFDQSVLGTRYEKGYYIWLGGFFILPYLALEDTVDNRSDFLSEDGRTVDILTARTFRAGRFNTICYPFSVTATELAATFGSDYELCQLYAASSTGGTLHLYFTKHVEDLKPGKPYLLKVTKDVVNPFYPDRTIDATATTASTVNYDGGTVTFHGVFWPTALTNNDRSTLFLRNDTLYYPSTMTGDCMIYGQRGYFSLTSATAKPETFSINIDNGTSTSIEGIRDHVSSSHSNAPTYNITGQRVSNSYKGIVIRNGHKHFQR